MSNVIKLPSSQKPVDEWLEEVMAEAEEFKANCGVTILWNAEQEMVMMKHPALTQAQGALMAIDLLKVIIESRAHEDEDGCPL